MTVGATLLTVTVKVALSAAAAPASVTVMVTVYVPSSAYVWLWSVMSPALVSLKRVSVEASPQSTLTAHGLSAPLSVKLPRSKLLGVPSSAIWSAGGVISGATLLTTTSKVSGSELMPVPDSSTTVTVTVYVPSSA